MIYRVTKTYGHERGLSCAFRQPRARSHCRWLHGYSLGFSFDFESDRLNANNWVIDFGSLKWLKDKLDHYFDHTTVIAENDPMLPMFRELHDKDAIDLRIMPRVGCEAFAEFLFKTAAPECRSTHRGVEIVSVTVSEHGSNSATVRA